jgi:molybdopterin-containing oxidoreductase family membrane subunit
VASARYLYFGLRGRSALVPWIWTAIALDSVATVLLVLPASRGLRVLNVACVAAIIGIWIEKGMGLIIPAFVPTPLGEIVEYVPTWNEILVCIGIWSFGLLLYTIFVRMSVPVLQGDLTYRKRHDAGAEGPRTAATS